MNFNCYNYCDGNCSRIDGDVVIDYKRPKNGNYPGTDIIGEKDCEVVRTRPLSIKENQLEKTAQDSR